MEFLVPSEMVTYLQLQVPAQVLQVKKRVRIIQPFFLKGVETLCLHHVIGYNYSIYDMILQICVAWLRKYLHNQAGIVALNSVLLKGTLECSQEFQYPICSHAQVFLHIHAHPIQSGNGKYIRMTT
jgi:hypothetical protein